MLARIHVGRTSRDNATPNRPACLIVSHEAADRSIHDEIDQLMAVRQGAGLKKLAQGRFDNSGGQMRKPSALDPTGVWNFQAPGGIPALMNVQTYYRPHPMSSNLPRNSSLKSGGETLRKTRRDYARNCPRKKSKNSLAKKIQNHPGKSLLSQIAKSQATNNQNNSAKIPPTPKTRAHPTATKKNIPSQQTPTETDPHHVSGQHTPQ